MENFILPLYIFAGLLACLIIILPFVKWLKERERRLISDQKLSQIPELERSLKVKEEQLAKLQEENSSLKSKVAEKDVHIATQIAKDQEKQNYFSQVQKQFMDTFKALSADALRNNAHSFIELATAKFEKLHEGAKGDLQLKQQAIDELIKPIKSSLEKVDLKIHELEKNRLSAYTSLNEQVHSLVKTQAMLHSETSNLVKALRMPYVRGRWGEVQLRRVVEMAGMVEHCDFTQQETINTDEKRLRPDLIVKLPNERMIIVDSKVPLQGYLESLEAQDEQTRLVKLKDHARQVRTHISQLSTKAYWDQFQTVPEFVVLFLPGETFFSAALEQDPELIEWGVNQKVIVSTPTTLIALLRSVAFGWRQENIAENAQKVSELGSSLYERLSSFVEHFIDMRKGLDRAVESYNKAVGSFETRVLVTARKFKDFGATAKEEIPLLDPIDTVTRMMKE